MDSYPESVAIGDVTGDGLPDVVMNTTHYGSSPNDYHVFVYPQLVGGTLGSPTGYPYLAFANLSGLVLADLNEDGTLDVIVGHASGISILLADGAGALETATVVPDGDANTLAAMDVDLDDHVDVISLGWSRGASIFYGDGTGGFPRIDPLETNASGRNDHEVEDVNNDGFIDLVVLSGGTGPQMSVHLHDGVGGFLPPETYIVGTPRWSIGLGDVTGDGLHDVVGSKPLNSGSVWIRPQNSAGQLDSSKALITYDIPEPVEVADLDGDSREDIAVAHGGWSALGIYLQQPSGDLAPEQLYPVPNSSHYAKQGLAIGDFSSDGCGDVAIASSGTGLVVLYGCAPPVNDGGTDAQPPDALPPDAPPPDVLSPRDAPFEVAPFDAASECTGACGDGCCADGEDCRSCDADCGSCMEPGLEPTVDSGVEPPPDGPFDQAMDGGAEPPLDASIDGRSGEPTVDATSDVRGDEAARDGRPADVGTVLGDAGLSGARTADGCACTVGHSESAPHSRPWMWSLFVLGALLRPRQRIRAR